ncbi:MAG: DNA-3-methyladenine glycosylase I, partial [Bacteroidota bacterium]
MTDNDRCSWCLVDDLYRQYHDLEWGRPSFDDDHLFEHLILETFQAGLSWHIILK